MPSDTVKQRAIQALRDLPDDATFEDAIERLVFLAKIDIGLSELDGASPCYDPAFAEACDVRSKSVYNHRDRVIASRGGCAPEAAVDL